MALIKNIKLFLDSKQCNLNFQYSFVGIRQVLRGRDSILNMNFKLEILANLERTEKIGVMALFESQRFDHKIYQN